MQAYSSQWFFLSRLCMLRRNIHLTNPPSRCVAGLHKAPSYCACSPAAGFNARPCTRCPGGLTTADMGAMSSLQCVAPPGEQRCCSAASWCPQHLRLEAGLFPQPHTKNPHKATHSCTARSGFTMLRGKAVACAQGWYKPSTGNGECLRCPTGWTTAFNTTAAASVAACSCELNRT